MPTLRTKPGIIKIGSLLFMISIRKIVTVNCRVNFKFITGIFCLVAICGSLPSKAEDLIWTTGKVESADGRPVVGAVVAAYDDNNKVVDYARTDRFGEYALAVPKRALHVDKQSPGFFARVMSTAIRFGGDTVGFVTNPVRQGVHAVTSAESATISDPITKGTFAAGGAVADQVLNMLTPPRHRGFKPKQDRLQPGAIMLKVVAPNSNDLVDVGRVYWMEQEETRVGGTTKKTIAAWVDPVKLASGGSDDSSKFDVKYLKFTHVRLEPSVAEQGDHVRLSAKLVIPSDPHVSIVVIARHSRSGEIWELHQTQPETYEAEITIGKKFPYDDQSIVVVAYAELNQKPGRRKDVEHAIDVTGTFDPLKPFVCNPLLLVSRNRGEATLTVVKPSKKKK